MFHAAINPLKGPYLVTSYCKGTEYQHPKKQWTTMHTTCAFWKELFPFSTCGSVTLLLTYSQVLLISALAQPHAGLQEHTHTPQRRHEERSSHSQVPPQAQLTMSTAAKHWLSQPELWTQDICLPTSLYKATPKGENSHSVHTSLKNFIPQLTLDIF